jgi:hypothetical protein
VCLGQLFKAGAVPGEVFTSRTDDHAVSHLGATFGIGNTYPTGAIPGNGLNIKGIGLEFHAANRLGEDGKFIAAMPQIGA